MTDKDIIKALECCNRPANQTSCDDCPYQFSDEKCSSKLIDDTLDLINRQTEEIERLEDEIDKQYEQAEADILGNISDGGTSCHWCIDKHKSEAIKEFAEMLKANYSVFHAYNGGSIKSKIDNLVKEMTD